MLRGVVVHWDSERNYSFLAPSNWTRYDVRGMEGVIYVPEQDVATRFHVEVEDLPMELRHDGPLTEIELSALHEATLQELMALPTCEILHQSEISRGPAIGYEFMLTFAQDGQTCQRRMRVLYGNGQRFTIYGQAVPQGDYDVFDSAFEWVYRSFTFGDLRDQLPKVAE